MGKKVRLFIRVRKQGAYVASVPLRTVEKMSRRSGKYWYLEEGWLVLGSS